MIISTGGAASVTYKNSAGKKRHTDYMGTDATRKAEREFNRKSDDENYTKNRDRMELVYQTDKALRRAKRKAQKLGIKPIPWSCSLEGSGGRLFFMA